MFRLITIAIRHPKKIIKFFTTLFTKGPFVVIKKLKRTESVDDYGGFINRQYRDKFSQYYPDEKLLKKQRRDYKKFKLKPKISLITPTFNTPAKFLRECIESVLRQSYQNWELCIVDDNSADEKVRLIIKEYSQKDPRIKYFFRKESGHISKTSNTAISIASGEYLGILDHDDLLWPNALFEMVMMINNNPQAELIYSDEDKVDEDNREHIEPFFKPGFSPDYLRSINYITHFTILSNKLIKQLQGFNPKYDGAQDWDLFLRASLLTDQIVHVPKILYSWRISKMSAASAKALTNIKKYAILAQKKALEDDLERRGLKGLVIPTQYLGVWQIKYQILGYPKVSIVIPTKDKLDYLMRCLRSIRKSTYKNYEIIIVDTGSGEETLKYYKRVESGKIRVVFWKEQFNFSKVCNFGANFASGNFLIFLNNDTQIVTKYWIENMLAHAQRKEIGAVGCKLIFPNGRLQHIGVVLGISGGFSKIGIAGHPFKNFLNKYRNGSYSLIIDTVRNYSAVTAACLMVSKKKFKMVNGFDEKLRVAFNDIDFCLKLLKKGFYNVYTPYVLVRHWESVSVGVPGKKGRKLEEYYQEEQVMVDRWDLKHDQFYNPNLTLQSEEWTLR